MAFEGNPGANRLAWVLSQRMKKESASPLVLDFGEIQADGSLVTNTFPVPIPRGDYSVLRQLTLGPLGTQLTVTAEDGSHFHSGGSHSHSGGVHSHSVLVPEKMRSMEPGDRVLVAWVQNEAVVIDLITSS